MILFAVISGCAAVFMLVLLIIKKFEIRSIKNQLDRISASDSNELLHSDCGGANLINIINSLLKEMRKSKAIYLQKRNDIEQMMANISHDLRTPLTSAMGYMDIIINSDLPQDEKDREIVIVQQRLLRLEELINSFFEFSKIISGDKSPEREKIDIIGILQECIAHYYDDCCARNQEIHFKCRREKLNICSDEKMLVRIFDNLISNACRHGSGDLIVSVNENAENIRIIFENEFIGSRINTDRIFDEFYKTDISRTGENTGLGLAIAKQFTEMLGGKISASHDGKVFAITVEFSVK